VARWAAARITNGGDDEKFIAITKDLRDPTIVLDSQGGVVDAVCRIGHVIYIKRYETRVNAGAGCNSACPFIWLAGAWSSLHLNSLPLGTRESKLIV
jgi:hypothetical protein